MTDPARRSCSIYTVDAFTDEPFRGNPAAVCLVPADLDIPDDLKQRIAAEMNLSETAYLELLSPDSTFTDSSKFKLRWFTPTNEVDLCGHATLASSAVLLFGVGNTSSEIEFSSKSGPLVAKRFGDKITLNFPLNPTQKPVSDKITLNFPLNPTQKPDMDRVKNVLKGVCEDSAKIQDVEYSPTTRKLVVRLPDTTTRAEFEAWAVDAAALQAGDTTDYLRAVIITMRGSRDNGAELESLPVDTVALQACDVTGYVRGVIVTVKGAPDNGCKDRHGEMYDFVSRYFAPWNGIPEDPVTGAAHTVLADYWRKQLGKSSFYARQCSQRGGDLYVAIDGDRVMLTGRAQIVLKGELYL